MITVCPACRATYEWTGRIYCPACKYPTSEYQGKIYIIKSHGSHMVLCRGYTWYPQSEWERPQFFTSEHAATHFAKKLGGEVVEWKGEFP